jgi:glycosyltransferase involved in cell wall biosynthesis
LCFAPEHVDELTDRLARLIADGTLRSRLGAEARRTIERRELTWGHNAVRIARAYDELTNAGHVDPACADAQEETCGS